MLNCYIKQAVCFILFFVLFYGNTQIPKEPAVVDQSSDQEAIYLNKVKEVMDPKLKNETAGTVPIEKSNIGYYSYFRLILTLVIICGLIYVVYFFLKKKLRSHMEAAGIESSVLLVQSLGTGKTIQVVFIAGKYLLIGVTNETINCLGEITDEKEIERLEILYNDKKVKSGTTFNEMFQNFLNRTFGKKREKEEFDYEKDSISFLKEENERLKKLKDEKEK